MVSDTVEEFYNWMLPAYIINSYLLFLAGVSFCSDEFHSWGFSFKDTTGKLGEVQEAKFSQYLYGCSEKVCTQRG